MPFSWKFRLPLGREISMKYFKPNSLTWWASVTPLLMGVVIATEQLHGMTPVVLFLNSLTDNVGAYALINAGLAGIGIRGAL